MVEYNKIVKSKETRELHFFCTITFLSIVINVFFINTMIINRSVTWHTYVVIFLILFYERFVLHNMYKCFFLKIKSPITFKSLTLTTEIIGFIIAKIIHLKHHTFLLSAFIISVFIDVLIILFTWSIFIWFEKRNKKTSDDFIN
ncbi:MAG: hypothetical protein RLZZ102_562 [Pseudomonadota bacterium]|jgi:hypothetical protein